MAAGIHGAGAQRLVMQVPRSLRFASAVVAVDPPECLSKDLAMGLPESSSSVAAVELRRSPFFSAPCCPVRYAFPCRACLPACRIRFQFAAERALGIDAPLIWVYLYIDL